MAKGNFVKLLIWFPIVVVCILYSSKTLTDFPVKFTATCGFLTLFCAYAATLKNVNLVDINRAVINISLLLVYVIYSLYSLFISNNLADGVYQWYTLFLVLVLTVGISNITFERLLIELPKAFITLGLLLIVMGFKDLFQLMIRGKISIPDDTYEIKALFGHRNLYAQMLFFTLPFAVHVAIYAKSKIWKILGYLSTSGALFLLIILSNRATWIALLAGLILISSMHFYFHEKKAENNYFTLRFSDYKLIAWIGVTIIVAALLFYKLFSNVSSIQKHTKDIVNFEAGSTKDRIYLWRNTLQVIKEKPIAGHGLATWKFEILKYGDKGLESEDHRTFYQTPHNDFLWILSEQGIIGFLLYTALLLVVTFFIIKNIMLSHNQQEFLFNNLLLFAFFGYCVYSFFSFPKERIEDLIVFSLILGTALSATNKQGVKKANFRLTNSIILSCFGLLILGIVIGVIRYKSEAHLKIGINAKEAGNYGRVISEVELATNSLYKTDPFSTPLSWYTGSAYYNLKRYDEAFANFKAAYLINPYHIHTLNNLASCYELKGDHKQAIAYYEKAIHISPSFDEAWLNLCAVYFNQQLIDKAYAAISNIDPNTTLPNYRRFLKIVLKSKISNILANRPKNTFKAVWEQNINNEAWYFNLQQQSMVKNIPIDRLIENY